MNRRAIIIFLVVCNVIGLVSYVAGRDNGRRSMAQSINTLTTERDLWKSGFYLVNDTWKASVSGDQGKATLLFADWKAKHPGVKQ